MALGLLRRSRSRSASGPARDLSLPLPAGAGAYGCEVVDPMGQPLGGAEVTVTAMDSHRVAARGTTDPYGLFMAALPPGSYSVMVAAEDLTPARSGVDITAGAVLPRRASNCCPPGGWNCRRPAPGCSTRRTPRSASSPSTSAWPMSTAASPASPAASASHRT
ncbi:hypothetical protein SHKM778_36620 [Streptomyces sp. KM77-8]|uniref:Carboxypeptidase regulatory-like domain-containing protein n=1 Tax=Streptomyces haneummycinicus TaxID=3074435 RepID=A0AAT9HIP1_9ACTN